MNIDILKLIVVVVALLYFNFKVKAHINKENCSLINIGLCLLLFASILDFTDGFKSLNNILILGKNDPLHDVLEDQFGDTPGLALLIMGAFREILRRNK